MRCVWNKSYLWVHSSIQFIQRIDVSSLILVTTSHKCVSDEERCFFSCLLLCAALFVVRRSQWSLPIFIAIELHVKMIEMVICDSKNQNEDTRKNNKNEIVDCAITFFFVFFFLFNFSDLIRFRFFIHFSSMQGHRIILRMSWTWFGFWCPNL